MLPDIVTMNHAHSTHYTLSPDPGIKYVLHGWADDEKPARIDLQYKDVRVRNVPTNIRTFEGGTERHGNSIFIFEVANLCIAHLGHLHHTLTQQQLNEIGRVDIVLVPVDGSYTLDLDGMVEVLARAQGAADDPDAFFQRLHARPLSAACPPGLGSGSRRNTIAGGIQDKPARQSRRCLCCPAINFCR